MRHGNIGMSLEQILRAKGAAEAYIEEKVKAAGEQYVGAEPPAPAPAPSTAPKRRHHR